MRMLGLAMNMDNKDVAVGSRVRFFSVRVFGAWVDATVVRVGPRSVTLRASFGGASWVERRTRGVALYYPAGHPQAGDEIVYAD